MSRSTVPSAIRSDRIAPLRLSDNEVKNYSFMRALQAAARGDWFEARFEHECSLELATRSGAASPDPHKFYLPPQIAARRDLTVASATGGGFLADSPVTGVIDALRPSNLAGLLGAQTLSGFRANTTYARQGGTSTATWQPLESTPATETTNYDLGSLSIAAHTVACYVESSRQLLKMAPDLAEQLILRDLRRTVGTVVGSVTFNGTGASGQPLGLLNTSGIGTFDGAALAYADLLEAQTDILSANALNEGGEVSFACRPAVASLLANRQGFSTTAPLWLGPLARGRLVECPAFSSMNLPADTLAGGDFSNLLLAEFGAGLEIRVNPYEVTNFKAGIVGFGAFLTMDVAVLHPQSFSVAASVS
jgi:HK97 family phage major capsid protein